jgi:hypothetical protein
MDLSPTSVSKAITGMVAGHPHNGDGAGPSSRTEENQRHERSSVVADADPLCQAIERIFTAGLALNDIPANRVNPETAARIEQAVDELDKALRDITMFALQSR